MEHLSFWWPEAEHFRTDEETKQWRYISPFYTVRWGRGCYFIKINRMRSKYFGGLIYVSLSRKRLRFTGNSQDSTLHNVTLYLWQLTDCPSYGYISNIFSVYVYVQEMCVNTHLHETYVFRIETWLSKTKKVVKPVRVCAVEPSKRSFDYGTWL